MSDATEPRQNTPFPAGAPPAIAQLDPLAGDWSLGLRGAVRALGISEPKLLPIEHVAPPPPPPWAGPPPSVLVPPSAEPATPWSEPVGAPPAPAQWEAPVAVAPAQPQESPWGAVSATAQTVISKVPGVAPPAWEAPPAP